MIDGHPADYDDPTILVGAKENYEARCRHCHEVPHAAAEARTTSPQLTLIENGSGDTRIEPRMARL
jgi:hypothetical protein